MTTLFTNTGTSGVFLCLPENNCIHRFEEAKSEKAVLVTIDFGEVTIQNHCSLAVVIVHFLKSYQSSNSIKLQMSFI